MKRLATLIFYVVGAVAIAYLALYAYAALTWPHTNSRRSDPDFPQTRRAELFGDCARADGGHSKGKSQFPSWPGLTRPSTYFSFIGNEDVDARHEAGHDGLRDDAQTASGDGRPLRGGR